MNTRAKSSRWLAGRGCVLVAAAVFVAPAMARARSPVHGQLEVSSQGLCIHGVAFRKTIPLADLQVSRARIVDFEQEPSLRPWVKIYGIGLPSFRSGWYLLKDHEKALLLVTDSRYAVYIPTNRGYALLLSSDQPEKLLAALRRPEAIGQVSGSRSGQQP